MWTHDEKRLLFFEFHTVTLHPARPGGCRIGECENSFLFFESSYKDTCPCNFLYSMKVYIQDQIFYIWHPADF